jgi:hypothetical protein
MNSQKNVSINLKVKFRRVKKISHFDEKEKELLWPSSQEKSLIKNNLRETIMQMRRGRIDIGEENFCTQGLEQYATNHVCEKITSRQVVMREQEQQRQQVGYCEEESLSRVYQAFSSESQERANERAREHSQAAEGDEEGPSKPSVSSTKQLRIGKVLPAVSSQPPQRQRSINSRAA